MSIKKSIKKMVKEIKSDDDKQLENIDTCKKNLKDLSDTK